MRLDAFLAYTYPDFSRSTFQKFIADSRIEVNGQVTTNNKKNISENDEVVVNFPIPTSHDEQAAEFMKQIIYEDDNVIVINKPAGVLTHAKGALDEEFTVADFIKTRLGADSDLPDNNRTGIVHRLDRATSGILIAAKNAASQKLLQKQFADRKAHKTYLAITEHPPKLDKAQINLPIGRDPKMPSRFRVDGKGKSAVTDYKVLDYLTNGQALLQLKPATGRTHQLRVHLAHIGAPILGDIIYGKDKASHMFLHAAELEITIPGRTDNQRRTFTAPLPDYFQKYLFDAGVSTHAE
jgi:23S rRNA pseudouridine1911/1915/1917 synthase